MEAKTLHNSEMSGTRTNVQDVKFFGDGDMWQLLCKASSAGQGWMKSTKALPLHNGCLVQVTTQQRNEDGTNAIAEAVTFVPNVQIVVEQDGAGAIIGRRLISNAIPTTNAL